MLGLGPALLITLDWRTRELTGMSKARNGDAQAIWGLVLSSGAARSAKPGSGDGKIVANNGQMARLGDGQCLFAVK